jgi:hypothetical protein
MGEPFRGDDAPEGRWFAGADTDHDGQLSRAEFLADAMRFFAELDLDHDHRIGSAEIDRYEADVLPEAGAAGADGGWAGRDAGGDRGAGGPRRGRGGAGGMGGRGRGGMGAGRSGEMEGTGERPGAGAGGYTFRASGAGRFGYIVTPEPVTAADVDLDRTVTDKEFLAAAGRRFDLLDRNGDGVITAKELPKLDHSAARRGRRLHDAEESDQPRRE